MEYTLTVHVGSDDIGFLKKAGYKLCIAKKVNGTYNTIWQGGEFFYTNVFKWTSRYEVFGTQKPQDGALVSATTETPEIEFGEVATIDNLGRMNTPSGTRDKSGSFTVNNQYGTIYIGVSSYVNGSFKPIFVNDMPNVTGSIKLTPVEMILVWFDATHTTSTMITTSISNSIEVPFTTFANRSVTYVSNSTDPGNGAWLLDSQVALASSFNPTTKLFTVKAPSPQLLVKLAQIAAQQGKTDRSITIKALVEFDEAASHITAGDGFDKYASTNQPDGLLEWDVSATRDTVEVRMAPTDSSAGISAVFKEMQEAFLGVLDGYTAAQYKRLTFEVLNA